MKKDLIVLHGALGASRQFEGLRCILERDFNVHLMDFNGHGGKVPDENFGIHQFAHQLELFLKEKELVQPAVFGYSMGGYVALYLESRMPGTFAKIMTLGTKFFWNPESSVRESSFLNADKILEKVPAYAEFLKELHGSSWIQTLNATRNMMISLGNQPLLSETSLVKIEASCLISVGELDQMVSQEETGKLAELIPGAVLKIWQGVQHPFEKVSDDFMARAISDFISD